MFLATIGDSESTVPLLKSNRIVSTNEEERQKPHPAENSSAEGTQDRTDTVTVQKEEMRDLID